MGEGIRDVQLGNVSDMPEPAGDTELRLDDVADAESRELLGELASQLALCCAFSDQGSASMPSPSRPRNGSNVSWEGCISKTGYSKAISGNAEFLMVPFAPGTRR